MRLVRHDVVGTRPAPARILTRDARDGRRQAPLPARRVARHEHFQRSDPQPLSVPVDAAAVEAVLVAADKIASVERDQARRARLGESLRDQFRFREYLDLRKADPGHTFRDHLKRIGAAIEV